MCVRVCAVCLCCLCPNLPRHRFLHHLLPTKLLLIEHVSGQCITQLKLSTSLDKLRKMDAPGSMRQSDSSKISIYILIYSIYVYLFFISIIFLICLLCDFSSILRGTLCSGCRQERTEDSWRSHRSRAHCVLRRFSSVAHGGDQ
jgi:hypothetical protein